MIKNPKIPIKIANILPTFAAILVAFMYDILPASTALNTLPPSIGNAGIRLKIKRTTFIYPISQTILR